MKRALDKGHRLGLFVFVWVAIGTLAPFILLRFFHFELHLGASFFNPWILAALFFFFIVLTF